MDSLLFSLNATVPIFLMMLLGLLFRRFGWLDEALAGRLNQFVFRVPLPIMVFSDLATVDIHSAWDTGFVLFCFAITVLSIAIAWALSYLWHDRSLQGEFIQASYRSSAALVGMALMQNLYGSSSMAPLMIIGSVPLYNIMAVVVLSLFGKERRGLDGQTMRRTAKGIVTNPILLGILAGLLWAALKLPMPSILNKTISSLGGTATPLGLMALGASFDIKATAGRLLPAVTAAFMKLIGFCALFLPAAIALGFRQEALAAILVMLGSATTVSGYVMARNMGHEGVLSASVVVLTTLFSAFTITGWLWLLRSLGYI